MLLSRQIRAEGSSNVQKLLNVTLGGQMWIPLAAGFAPAQRDRGSAVDYMAATGPEIMAMHSRFQDKFSQAKYGNTLDTYENPSSKLLLYTFLGKSTTGSPSGQRREGITALRAARRSIFEASSPVVRFALRRARGNRRVHWAHGARG